MAARSNLLTAGDDFEPAQEQIEARSMRTIKNCGKPSVIVIASRAPILGVDVGEDYLDLAMLAADRTSLAYHRVPLDGIRRPVAESIAHRIAAAVGLDLRGSVALVDSPRAPRDVDCSRGKMVQRMEPPQARVIDASLRALLRSTFNGTMRPLSMFPPPPASYFAECVANTGCKPHLRAIAEELLASVIDIPRATRTGSIAGGTFTRFMLAGFAVFPALEQLGIRAFESYPDLQMRLWSDAVQLPPKRLRGEALRVRRNICAQLAAIIKVTNFEAPKTLDEADAAVLALSAAASASTESLIELHCRPEGRFAVAFKAEMNGHRT
jgi:hypothetical protein